ncbi:phage integrase-related [Anaeramoeba flamelloides]|uniref:Phage integrase-related n=1 Tax=Anaeramoeba flamelloides TaxID=1746091 RepID=A0AAV8AB29_9EUKA|nr:phage integrase-related [Anaeramoeba flamelloides]
MVHCLISYLRRVWQQNELGNYPTLEKLYRTQATLDRNLNQLKEENKVGKHKAWLTEEEEDRFLSSLDLEDPYDLLVCAFWLTGIFTGYRGGEYYQILQRDVSWEEEDGELFIKIIQRVKKKTIRELQNKKGCFEDFKFIFNYTAAKFNPYEIIKKYFNHCPKRNPNASFWCSVTVSFTFKAQTFNEI